MVSTTVGIPTLLRNSLKKTLEALMNQNEDDFEVLITYKGNLTREIENFEKYLNIKFIEQKEGLFEEALNIILSNAKGKILITIDDDALPSKDWIRDHVIFHGNHKNVGIASGKVTGKRWINYPNYLYEKFKSTKYMEEYNEVFKDYIGYLTKTGLSVDRKEHKGNEKTLAIVGANMSLKREVYNYVRAIPFTLRGSYNETILSLQAIKMGFETRTFNKAEVYHIPNPSLSTPTKDEEWGLIVEKHTLPYAVNFIFPLEVELIKEFSTKIQGEARIGLELALKGIEEKMKPTDFRLILKKTVNGIRNL
ncbi:glycosyltransferase family A protein [Sulfurisphaera ohwakuensis]|uniref:glycosyltransferase family A protein n=1 Tax=Sulfurisphaera ohwakuensis TaxID=69656 RepID=UPI0036F43D98